MPTEIYCPFCNTLIVESTDISELYDEDGNFIRDEFYDNDFDDDDDDKNIDEDFDEEEEKSERLCDYTEGKCPHLAFWSDWAYAGSRIENNWLKEMYIFSFILNSYEDEDISIETIEKEAIKKFIDYDKLSPRDLSEIEHRIAEYLIDDEEFCQELLAKSFPEYETFLEIAFVDKGDGVHGSGGPTYMCIFLKKEQ